VSNVYRSALRGFAIKIPSTRLAEVQADPAVLTVELDRQVVAQQAQLLGRAVNRVDADLSSAVSGDGQGSVNVTVAVLDDGIDATHPDLNVVGGMSCTGDDPVRLPAGAYHGTMVAGWIGARDNDIGLVGVAPGARLFAVQTLHPDGHGSFAEEICGIDAVVATRLDGDPSNDVSVANGSFGSANTNPNKSGRCATSTKDIEHLAICRLIGAGVTYVAAAGNNKKDFDHTTPAAFDEVLTATAMTDTDGQLGSFGPLACDGSPSTQGGIHDRWPDDQVTPFSNWAVDPADWAHTVAAPGACQASTYPLTGCITAEIPDPTDCEARGSGTSYSAPIVAGTVAL